MPNNNQGNERNRMNQGGGQHGRQGGIGESEELERDVQSGRQGRESEELERDVQSEQGGGFRGRMEGAEERQERTPQSSTVSSDSDELEDEDEDSDSDELEDEDAELDIDSESRR